MEGREADTAAGGHFFFLLFLFFVLEGAAAVEIGRLFFFGARESGQDLIMHLCSVLDSQTIAQRNAIPPTSIHICIIITYSRRWWILRVTALRISCSYNEPIISLFTA